MQKQTVKKTLHIACVFLCTCINTSAWALPVGGHVNGGNAVLTTNANTLLIEQGSQQLSLEFDQFNIGENERVTFLQPNRDAVALNRIVGGNASELLGQLESNGQVFLINPNGILFGRNSQVNVGGLMATTLNITDDDFFNGRWSFSASQGINEFNASIQNLGNITALDNGYIALVAPNILNEGDLNSPDGSVALHSAGAVVMSFAGQQLLNIETDQASLNAAIKNSGSIYADGGQVLLTAAATNGLLKTVIDNSGIISAQRIEQSGGRIFLSATDTTEQGDILNTGMINGSQQTEGDGGTIEIIGDKIAQLGVINANGQGSGGGGDINVHALDGIVIANDSHTFANGGGNGDGGMIRYFTFGQAAFYNGSVMEAKGGIDSGDGGFIEVSGVQQVLIDGLANTSAANGDTGLFYIDPTDIDIIAGGGNVNGAFVTGGGFSDWLPDTVGSSNIGTDLITTLLSSNNVTIDTAAANTGADTGILTVSTAIDLNGGNGKTLTLRSNNLMTITQNICDMGGGANCLASPDDAVNLVFDTKTNASNGHISIGGIEINSGGGDITFTSDAGLTLGTGGTFDSGVGNILATIDDTVQLGGSVNIRSTTGTIGLTSTLQSVTTAANTAIASTSGAVSLNANQAITMQATSSINSGSGSLALTTTNGDVTLTGLVSTKTASTNVITITAGGSILDGGDTNIDLSAVNGDITLTAATGIVDLETNAAEGNFTNSTSGNVVINESSDIEIQTVNVAANFDLTSQGSIDLITGAVTSVQSLDLDAAVNLIIPNAGINIGNGATQILNLRGADIYNKDLSRPLSLTAESLSFTSGLSSGNTTITSDVAILSVVNGSSNTLTINDNDALDVILASMNNGTLNINSGAGSDLTLNTVGGSLTGIGGSLNLTSGNNLNIDANIAGAAGSTNISLSATSGSVIFGAGVSVNSGGGNIVLSANTVGQEVNVTGMSFVDSEGGKIIISGDAIKVSNIVSTNSADDAISLTSNSDIQDNGAGVDVTAINGGVVLISKTGIQDTSGAQSFDVSAAKINVTNSVSGIINLDITNSTEIVDIDSVGDFTLLASGASSDVVLTNVTTIGGAIDMTVGGTLTIPNAGLISTSTLTLNVADIVDSVGGVSLGGTVGDISLGGIVGGKVINSSFDSVSLTSTGSDTISINDSNALVITDINATDNISITSSAGAGGIVINGYTASQGLTITANSGVSITDGVVIDAGSGDINITAFTNDIAVSGLKTTSSSSTAITLNSSGSITDSGASNIDISAVNGGVKLTSDTGINDIEIQVASLDATNNISGNIVINEVDDLSITQLLNAGDITINTSGNLSLDSNLDLNGMNGSTLTFNATGDLTLNANICEGGGTCAAVDDAVVLDFDAGGNFNTLGNIAINNGAANVSLDAVGSVTLNVGDTLVTEGDISIFGNAVRITGVQSTSSSATAVQINSATNIRDQAGVDVEATSGGVVLTATSGIFGTTGATATFDVNANKLTVINSVSGNVVIDTRNDLELVDVDVIDGFTLVSTLANNNLILSSVTNIGGDINLSPGGTLTIPNAGLNSNGTLTLSANIITDLSGAISLAGTTADITLSDSLGGITIDSSFDSLSLTTSGTSTITINETDNLSLTQLTGVGGVTVNAGGNLSVDSSLDLNGMNGNTLTLNATGDLTLNANVCEGGATCATVDDGVTLDFDAGGNFTTAGNITIHSGAGNINIDAVGSVTFNAGDSLVANGDIAIAGNAVRIAGIQSTSSSATAVQISSATDILNRAGIDITATFGGVLLTANTGIAGLETNVVSLSATNNTSGDIVINESNDLSITQLSNVGSITVNTGGNLALDSHLNLDGMGGSTVALNAGGNLTLNANVCEGGVLCLSVNDSVLLDLDAGGDLTTAGNISIDSGGGNISLDALGSMSLSLGDSVNAGVGHINITGNAVVLTGLESTATGDAITVTSATDILERTGNDARAINGVVTLNATSGIRGGGVTADLDVVAQEIRVSNTTSGEVRLNSGTFDTVLAQVDVAGLMLVNTTSGNITLQENALVAANDITFNSDSGSIVLPSAIALPGRLTLTGAQVTNTDQVLVLSAQELLLKISGNQNLVINVNNTIVDVSMAGDGDLQVNSSGGLTVADLDADSLAVNASNGNVVLNTLAGDLIINANISASDTTGNGVRSGLIELSVTDGDLIVGALNSVAITSTNTVDQNVGGGLTTGSGSQVSIYAHLNGQDNVNRTITLGDGSGDEVTFLAVGGDITLDAFNGANLVTANNRNVLINADATLTSYNQASDQQTGTVTSEGIVNNGLVQAHLDRQISLIANGISLSQEEIEEIKETVANEVQDNKPTEIVNDSASEQVGTDVDVAFSAVFDQCSVSSNEEEGNCGAQLAIKKFLGSLLIGGKLPSL